MSTVWHPAQSPLSELEKVCRFSATRRSGPGGQHRNKVETAVIVTHGPTGVRAEASERRSQAENRKVAYQRLRIQLALQVRCTPPSDRSELWNARSRGGKIGVSPTHEDFPALLAELLDHWQAADKDLAAAASQLGISISQAIKLLKLQPSALEMINQARRAVGQHSLK